MANSKRFQVQDDIILNEKSADSIDLKPLNWFLIGATFGLVTMFFLDPQRGKRRRALFRDKTVKYSNNLQWYVGRNYRNIKNHLRGWEANFNKIQESSPWLHMKTRSDNSLN